MKKTWKIGITTQSAPLFSPNPSAILCPECNNYSLPPTRSQIPPLLISILYEWDLFPFSLPPPPYRISYSFSQLFRKKLLNRFGLVLTDLVIYDFVKNNNFQRKIFPLNISILPMGSLRYSLSLSLISMKETLSKSLLTTKLSLIQSSTQISKLYVDSTLMKWTQPFLSLLECTMTPPSAFPSLPQSPVILPNRIFSVSYVKNTFLSAPILSASQVWPLPPHFSFLLVFQISLTHSSSFVRSPQRK